MPETYSEHLDWCKRRALEYLPGDPRQAFASMVSDLRKHPETADHPAIHLGAAMLMSGHLDRPDVVRHFIEGFG